MDVSDVFRRRIPVWDVPPVPWLRTDGRPDGGKDRTPSHSSLHPTPPRPLVPTGDSRHPTGSVTPLAVLSPETVFVVPTARIETWGPKKNPKTRVLVLRGLG